MDEGKVLLVNLAKGRIGEDSSALLGGLLVTAIGLAAYTRADMPEAQRRNFFVYVDEFQSFTTLALASMLSELRKYRVGFTIAHQYLHQLEPDVRHAVLGNVGSVISFRVGAEDAPYLVREFHERFDAGRLLAAAKPPDLPEADDRRDAVGALQRGYARAGQHALSRATA